MKDKAKAHFPRTRARSLPIIQETKRASLKSRHSGARTRPPLAPSPTGAPNWMAQAGFGSFADVGKNLCSEMDSTASRLYLAVEVGEACQLECRHCIYHRRHPESSRPSNLVRDRLVAALDRGFEPGWVTYAGKEPTLFPNRLLEMARRTWRPNRPNILMTNGLKLTGDFLIELGQAITLFDVSLDGDRESHDWMRGSGTFLRTWENIEEVLQRTSARVGIISTAVNGPAVNDRPQPQELILLADRLKRMFGIGSRISLTVSLYYGPPDDKMLLTTQAIAELMIGLCQVGFPVRVLFTSNYAHQWSQVRDQIGWKHEKLMYDSLTGFPVVRSGLVDAILFNLTATNQLGLRISNDGLAYLGCNHLILGNDAVKFSIGDLRTEELDEIAERVLDGRVPLMDQVRLAPQSCLTCDRWESCRGGDRLSGIYYSDYPMDPYCSLLHEAFSE